MGGAAFASNATMNFEAILSYAVPSCCSIHSCSISPGRKIRIVQGSGESGGEGSLGVSYTVTVPEESGQPGEARAPRACRCGP